MTEFEWLEAFSDNLTKLVYESKLTQCDLSEMTGISQGTISKYLRGQQMPGIKAIINIADALGCSTDELIDFGEIIL